MKDTLSSKTRVSAENIAALREMAATVAVKGAFLLQLLDEIEERRASDETPARPALSGWKAPEDAFLYDGPAEKTDEGL